MSQWWRGESFNVRQTLVHETQKSDKPVLYDGNGKPLTYRRPKVGFVPPKERR